MRYKKIKYNDYGHINRSHNYKNKTRNYGNEYHASIKDYILTALVLVLLSGILALAGHWDYEDEFHGEFAYEQEATETGFFAGLFE